MLTALKAEWLANGWRMAGEWLEGGEADGYKSGYRPEEMIMASEANTIKDKVHQFLDKLPDNATWDNVVYELAVRSIERGMNDVDAGRLSDLSDVRREFGLE